MNTIKLLGTSLLILMLSACTAIPKKTPSGLLETDIMNINPSDFRMVQRLLKGLKEDSNGIQFSYIYWPKGKKEKKKALKFRFERDNDSARLLKLKPLAKPGHTIQLYKIPNNDISRINRFREEYFKTEAILGDNIERKIILGAHVCRTNTAVSNQALLASLWVRVSKNSELLALESDLDLRKGQKPLPLCGKKL